MVTKNYRFPSSFYQFFNVDISLFGTEELATQVISCTNFGTLIESEFEKNGRRRNRNRNGRREGD